MYGFKIAALLVVGVAFASTPTHGQMPGSSKYDVLINQHIISADEACILHKLEQIDHIDLQYQGLRLSEQIFTASTGQIAAIDRSVNRVSLETGNARRDDILWNRAPDGRIGHSTLHLRNITIIPQTGRMAESITTTKAEITDGVATPDGKPWALAPVTAPTKREWEIHQRTRDCFSKPTV